MNQSSRIRPLAFYSKICRAYCNRSETIVVPKRINRGPTDILRALAKTHRKDPGAPHYKFHDDPYLIPYSNSSKRSYALSQEAGRKAAYWVRQEHADLFSHSVADPPIESVHPPLLYKEDSNLTIEQLDAAIRNFLVSDAIIAYKSLLKQKLEIDYSTKLSLLQLICFYNEEEGILEDWIEERWYRSGAIEKTLLKKSWKDNSLAEQLFNSIKPPTSESYSSIIAGMSKFGQLNTAMHYYKEAKDSNIPLSVIAYNCLLSKVRFVSESHDLIWKTTEDLMKSMSNSNVNPNLGTYNAILESVSQMGSFNRSKEIALQVLSDMKVHGIEPSLGSFFHLINIFYFDRNQNSGILLDIIDYLEKNSSFKVCDFRDSGFFVRAMEICRHKLHDNNLAYRIDALLHHNENYNFIGDSFKEAQYYRFFFLLICENEDFGTLMKFYDNLVPHVYTPEPVVMMEILKSLELNMAYSHLPKLWTDIVHFNLNEQEKILSRFLQLLEQRAEEECNQEMVQIAWNIWERIEGINRERSSIGWTGEMLSDVLTVLLKGGEKSKSNLVINKFITLHNHLIGEPKISALSLFIDHCISDNTPDVAIKCIKYCQDVGFVETEELAERLKLSLTLTPQQLDRLNKVLVRDS